MKIDLSKIDTTYFNIKPNKINNEMVYLVVPLNIGCRWSRENLIFRSSLWNSEGELISASFKKFFNWLEQPAIVPIPLDIKELEAIQKIDGSTLIVSKYKGNIIARTRGTFEADTLENGSEIQELKLKYPKAFEFEGETSTYSRIFEWTTPTNKIVLDYGSEALLWYTAKIYHEDYSYATQKELDAEYESLGVLRPNTYTFDSLENFIKTVENFDGVEGCCIYFNKGQDIRKLKSLSYLKKHAFKSNASFENTLDLFLEYDCPSYQEFNEKLTSIFDWECVSMVMPYISQIVDGYEEVLKIIAGMNKFVEKISKLDTRKAQALEIQQAYSKTNRASMAFNILDNKKLDKNSLKKLIFQVCKKN